MCKALGLSLGYGEDQHTQQSSFTKNEKNITCTLHNTESVILVFSNILQAQKKRPQDFSTALYGQKHLNSNVNEKEATVGLKKFTVAIEDESLLGCLVYWCSTVCINYFCF